MAEKFTPGPWKIVIDRDADGNADRVEVQADDAGSCTIAVIETENGPHAVALADARLIAAAPELYAALEGVLQRVRALRVSDAWPEFDTARALLARIQGEG